MIEQHDELAAAAAAAMTASWRRNGRANAATIIRIAAHRISRSAQWRIRRRRTD
jgi:hypothetical protein